MIGGGMYAQYRLLKATDCQPLPAGTTAAEGASWFVNPLTALGTPPEPGARFISDQTSY